MTRGAKGFWALMSHEKAVRLFIGFVCGYRLGVPDAERLLPLGLYITMDHPTLGVHVRTAVSEALRRDLPVHVALCITDRNFMVCVCSGSTDGRELRQ